MLSHDKLILYVGTEKSFGAGRLLCIVYISKPKMIKQPIPLKFPRRPSNSDEMFAHRSTDPRSSTPFSKDSGTSTSSTQSLASLRELLPDNPNIYSFHEIKRATNNFQSGKLGNSSVWKCTLRGKSVVVTERSRTDLIDFRAKLRQICNVHHRSIIKLMGGCVEEEQIYLVYEYVEGASLKECLRGSRVPGYTVLSSWLSRMQIALDVAQGLEYLHHYTDLCYVHNYMKTSSVMVVEPGFRAMIAHFGTHELSGESFLITKEGSTDTGGHYRPPQGQRIVGTQGYMAPEYVANGVITQKTDVFSFGVVLLELLSGQGPVKLHYDAAKNEYNRVSFIEVLSSIVSKPDCLGKLRSWIDPRLKDSYPVDSAEKVARLAAMCLDVNPSKRPDMRHVAGELSKNFLMSKTWSEKMSANKAHITSTFAAR